jgi:hypothetical protein
MRIAIAIPGLLDSQLGDSHACKVQGINRTVSRSGDEIISILRAAWCHVACDGVEG